MPRAARHARVPIGELPLQVGHGSDDRTVVPRVGHEQDRAGRLEVALLGSQATLGGLDIVKASLGLDDSVEFAVPGYAIGTPKVSWDRDRDLGLPCHA